jgi:ketosteroid isomerase-like protein
MKEKTMLFLDATVPARLAATAPPEVRIQRLIEEKDRALCAKDLEGFLAHYAAVEGSRGLRRVWQACLPHLPASFHIETRDFVVTVAGELAVMHRLFRVPEVAGEQPGWIREIAVFRHAEGDWRIVHEHCSVA